MHSFWIQRLQSVSTLRGGARAVCDLVTLGRKILCQQIESTRAQKQQVAAAQLNPAAALEILELAAHHFAGRPQFHRKLLVRGVHLVFSLADLKQACSQALIDPPEGDFFNQHQQAGDARAIRFEHKIAEGDRLGQEFAEARHGQLCLAKIPSACVFIAFQLARVGRSRRLLTVKISRRLSNFSARWSFGEAQLYPGGFPGRSESHPDVAASRESTPAHPPWLAADVSPRNLPDLHGECYYDNL